MTDMHNDNPHNPNPHNDTVAGNAVTNATDAINAPRTDATYAANAPTAADTDTATSTPTATAIREFPRRKARTLRFGCGAPRSARVIGDGTRALFLRSDGPEDLVTALWMSVVGADGTHREVLLADPCELLADADDEDVPAEEKARRERAREGGSGIVSYSVDAAGLRVVYTINGRLFLTEIDEDGDGARTRELAAAWLDADPEMYAPVLNPRISPDGGHVLYTTGEHLMLVDIADWNSAAAWGSAADWRDEPAGDAQDGVFVAADIDEASISEGLFTAGDAADTTIDAAASDAADDAADTADAAANPAEAAADDRITAIYGVSVEDEDGNPAENTWKIGLAEFVAGEEMDRYDGFWWGPDSRHILFESFDTADEPSWYISDPANPEHPADGRRYPRALTTNADVYLTLIEVDYDDDDRYAGIVANHDVDWDRESYEYVAAVSWSSGHDPLVLVQNRRQTRDQVLLVATGSAADAGSSAAAGSTRVLEEHANDQWIDLIHGTPAFTPDGRLVCSLNDMETDTNRLTVDGRAFTPAGWQVREVLDVTDADVLCVVQRTPELAGDLPGEWAVSGGLGVGESQVADDARVAGDAQNGRNAHDAHDARSFDVVSFGFDGTITPITIEPGNWTASRGTRGLVVSGRDMAHARSRMWHITDGCAADAALIANHAATPGFTPNVTFTRLGEHRLYTAIIAPSADSPYAHADKLPVLMKPYGGPGFQQVVASQAYYWDAQWWADQGFLVVTSDGRGTTGRGPRWDRAIFENMKNVTLADQVEAVRALPGAVAAINVARAGIAATAAISAAADASVANVAVATGDGTADDDSIAADTVNDAACRQLPMPDLDKVCMIGWSYGGFLSALAVLDAPDVFAAACAGAPPTDWTLYDTHYTERYLGLDPEVYERNSIVADAPKLRRPLMLIHGFADDNVTIAHSLRLSQALMAAGRPHTFLPLTGITHMTNDETVAENLLLLQRDFLREALEA